MTTIGRFNRAWINFTIRCRAHNLGPEIMDRIRPSFLAFAAEFERQFGVNVQELDALPKGQEIRGEALEKLKAWVKRVKQFAGWDYGYWCGLKPYPSSSPPEALKIIYIFSRKTIFRKKPKAWRFKPRK